MLKRYWSKGIRQKIVLTILFLIVFTILFILRDDYQPALLFVRKYIFILLLCVVIFWLFFKKIRKSNASLGKLGTFIGMLVLFGLLYIVGAKTEMYEFMQKYNIYKNLNLKKIEKLPLTQNERIQPYNNIVTMAYESIEETEEVSLPQLVRIDSTNKWTMAIQPAKEYAWQRVSDNIEDIFSVPSTTAFPRFKGKNRHKVTFSIGESLSFSRNTYNAVVQKLNPLQYFNLEPGEVFYMKNDTDQWVEVVSLIKWKGFFFPYPTFGGVMVIKSGEHDVKDYLERIFFGKGTYISPSEMKNHPYLKGQNILSEKISRLQAQSLMFLGGFTDPLPWNKHTSVKIPDLKDDENQQPFVTDFVFDGVEKSAYNGLYHWFGLEPIGKERTSLSYSVFIPADGTNALYYYNHANKEEGIAGVSAMPLKVIESRKEYDWSVNKPVEFRPYIKDIAGKRRMFVLSTIAAKRKDSKKFDGAATPDVALVDSEYRDVIWVDVKYPENWNATILKQLGSVWKETEKNNDFFKKDSVLNTSNFDSLKGNKVVNDSIQPTKKELAVKDKIKQLEAIRDSLKIKQLEDEIKAMKKTKKDSVK